MINEAMANGGKRHGLGSGGDGGRRLHAASIISFDPTACFLPAAKPTGHRTVKGGNVKVPTRNP